MKDNLIVYKTSNLGPFSMFTRRLIAWPVTLLGWFFTILGGICLGFSIWALDLRVQREEPENSDL